MPAHLFVRGLMSQLIQDEHIETIAYKFRLLSRAERLDILNALHGGRELTLGEIIEETRSTHSPTYRNLRLMFAAGVLGKRREGMVVYYRIKDKKLLELLENANDHWGDSD